MKNVIKVSIGHWAFTLEEPAYQWMEAYLKKSKEYYRSEQKAEEIEIQLGEYLAARVKTVNQVVGESMIREAVKSLGLPDFADNEAEMSAAAEEKTNDHTTGRRLYRNPDGKVLGGVFSGFGAYFGIDPVGIRLIYTLFFVLGLFLFHGWDHSFSLAGLLFLLYLVLWICLPVAKTPEEKHRMYRGGSNEAKRVAHEFAGRAKDVAMEAKESPFWAFVGGFFRVFFGIIFILVGASGLILLPLSFWFVPFGLHDIFEVFSFTSGFVVCKVLLLICVFIPFLILFYEGVKLLFKLNMKNIRLGLILLLVWMISLLALAVSLAVSYRSYAASFLSTGSFEKQDYCEQPLSINSDTLYINLLSNDIFQGESYACVFGKDLFFCWQNAAENAVFILPEIRKIETNNKPSLKTKVSSFSRNIFDFEEKSQNLMSCVKFENGEVFVTPLRFTKERPWSLEQIKMDVFVPHGCTVLLRYGTDVPLTMSRGTYFPYVGYENAISKGANILTIPGVLPKL